MLHDDITAMSLRSLDDYVHEFFLFLFVCLLFNIQSTAMVMPRLSVDLTTLLSWASLD